MHSCTCNRINIYAHTHTYASTLQTLRKNKEDEVFRSEEMAQRVTCFLCKGEDVSVSSPKSCRAQHIDPRAATARRRQTREKLRELTGKLVWGTLQQSSIGPTR